MSNGPFTTAKNARARSIRTYNAAQASIDHLSKELQDRNPIETQFPPGVGPHGTKVDNEFKEAETSLNEHSTQHIDHTIETTALDLLRDISTLNEPHYDSRVEEQQKEAHNFEGYDDQYRNPNPGGKLSKAQMKRRFRLSAKVAWAKGSELVDMTAEDLRKAINAYDFDTCVRLIFKRQKKINSQKQLAGITKTSPSKTKSTGTSNSQQQQPEPHFWPSLVNVATSSGETALTKACGERGSAASVELLLSAGLNVEAQNKNGRTA
jgi:ankyrin repeat protein